MADLIEDNVWEGEEEVRLNDYEQDSGNDEFSVIEDSDGIRILNDNNDPQTLKREKKRKRLADAKERKRQRLSNDGVTNNAKSGPATNEGSRKTLTAEEMWSLIVTNKPSYLRKQNDSEEFTSSNFIYPDLDPSATTVSRKNKRICPFVRALSAGLPSYKKLLMNATSVEKDDFGCPVLIILCSSAIRATQIIKSISAKLIKCKISKLFAKHFKVEEQMQSLSSEYFPIAVGTPNRVAKLIELGALSLRKAKMLLIDVTPDAKKLNVLTLKDVSNDLYRFLYERVMPEREHLKIALVKE